MVNIIQSPAHAKVKKPYATYALTTYDENQTKQNAWDIS